jgi:Secretion system C-terminal sorting domain
LSNLGGNYLYRVNDNNRCYAPAGVSNTFRIRFSSTQLIWRIAPNPVKDIVTLEKIEPKEFIETEKPPLVKFTIMNLYSKQALFTTSQINMGTSFKIPVFGLKDGEYVLKIDYGTEVFYEKLLIRK